MQCVVLAGGLATRMRPITDRVPKALIPVNGTPFVDLQLRWLGHQGVTDVVFCIAHLGEQIRKFVGDGTQWNVNVRYSDEGAKRLGTAGALRLAAGSGLLANRFLVTYGDSYLKVNVRDAFDQWTASGLDAFMSVLCNDDQWDSSNAEVRDGRVVRYEKGVSDPTLQFIDYGLLGFRRELILGLLPNESIDLADVHRSLAASANLAAVVVADRFFEIGSSVGLAELERHLSVTGDG